MMTLPEALRKWGVTVVEVSGWQTRGWLSGYGGTWNPRGVVCHHTANGGFRGVDAPSLNVCINGRPDLAGPLCQIVLGYSGTAYVIAGRGANHAGRGGWAGLSGNAAVWGIEAENNGVGEPWPPAQIDAYHRCCAALAELSGFGPEMVCGHKEWTAQKIDPAGIDMNQFRSEVAALLDHQEDDDMTPEQAQQLANVTAAVADIQARVVDLEGHVKSPDHGLAKIQSGQAHIVKVLGQLQVAISDGTSGVAAVVARIAKKVGA